MPPHETPEPVPPPQAASPPPAPPPLPAPPSSAPREAPPDPWKWFQRCIYQRFGLKGFLLVAVLVPLVWSNWSTVKELPGVSSMRTWFSQASLPTVDPRRFAVALAHLEHDTARQYERRIR